VILKYSSDTMIKHNYSHYGLGSSMSSSLSSKALSGAPPLPPYTSPYSYSRYRGDYSHSNSQFSGSAAPAKYSDVTPYATPIPSYSRLQRGSSLQNVTNVNTSPKLSRRVSRQASLETDTPTLYGACASHAPRRQQARGPHEQLYYQDLRRRYGRQSSSEAGSGRGEAGHEKRRPVNCNKICTGIIIGNGETVCDLNYLKSAGVTHVLNTAEQHVSVSQARYAAHGIQYLGFHVDDLPHCNISRYFHRTTEFIHRAVTGGGLVAVNCYMGLSRSASVVIAYLMTKHDMSLERALGFVKKSRNVRPNEGFVRQLKDLELSLKRRR